jgi:hypothetical protein
MLGFKHLMIMWLLKIFHYTDHLWLYWTCSYVLCSIIIFWASMCYPLRVCLSKITDCEVLPFKSSLRRIQNCVSWSCRSWHPDLTWRSTVSFVSFFLFLFVTNILSFKIQTIRLLCFFSRTWKIRRIKSAKE